MTKNGFGQCGMANALMAPWMSTIFQSLPDFLKRVVFMPVLLLMPSSIVYDLGRMVTSESCSRARIGDLYTLRDHLSQLHSEILTSWNSG